MAKIKNPVTIVQSGGATPTLITKNITANGDHAASDDGADGYSSVHVEVPGEEVFYATRAGTPYPKKLVIPSGVGDSTRNQPQFTLWYAIYLEEIEFLTEKFTILPSNFLIYSGGIPSCPRLHRIYLPYIKTLQSNCLQFRDYTPALIGIAQFGSVGNPVTSINSVAFASQNQSYTTLTGKDWTLHIYVNATTLAEAATLLPNAPWGASAATIVYHNSTTGEVITE